MRIDELVDLLPGYDINIEYDSEAEMWTMMVCRPEWVTHELYDAKRLPVGKGKTPEIAFADLKTCINFGFVSS